MLVRGLGVGHIPLKTGFNEAGGESPVVPVQDQVDGSECIGCLALIDEDVGWGDSNPEGIEGGGGVEVVVNVRSQVVMVGGKLFGTPEEVEDASAEV